MVKIEVPGQCLRNISNDDAQTSVHIRITRSIYLKEIFPIPSKDVDRKEVPKFIYKTNMQNDSYSKATL